MQRRRRLPVVLGAVGAIWLAVAIGAPRPENPPGVDPAARLEAGTSVPASTAQLLHTACFDCHSNETIWPWYSRVFPVSWLVKRDVERGRGQLNFSTWSEYNVFDRADLLDSACEQVRSGTMPLRPYRWLHPEARLSEAEIVTLCAWAALEAERLVTGGAQ